MKKYFAIYLSEQDGPLRAAVYGAAEVDARIAELEKALTRLASSEAFDVSRSLDADRDKELIMRMDYAKSFL